MAKTGQIRKGIVDIYPRTITEAIADVKKGKLLSDIIEDIETSTSSITESQIRALFS